MRIVFAEAVQSYGGAQIATIDLASRLQLRGHEVFIVDCYGSCVPFMNSLRNNNLNYVLLVPRNEPFVISKYDSKFRNLLRLVEYFPHWLYVRRRMRDVLQNIAPDIVICNNHKVLSFINRSNSYKLVYYEHGWGLPTQIGRLKRFYLKHNVSHIIAVSEATRMAMYAAKIASLDCISVVHNAIDLIDFNNTIASDNSNQPFKILVSAGFLPDKGIHIAIEVARELEKRGFSFKMIITGIIYKGAISEPYYKSICELIEIYNLQDKVSLVVNNYNVREYFVATDCLIHPSSSEGFGLVILESMALKKPVIANAVGGVVDMILNNYTGILSPYNNVQFYADSIQRLASDYDFRDFITSNAYSMVKFTFSKEAQISALERVIIQISQ